MIEDVKDDIDKIPDSDFTKAAAIVCDEIHNGRSGILPSSYFFDFIKTLGGVFLMSSWRASCVN